MTPLLLVLALLAVALALVLVVVARPAMTRNPGGRALAFVALFVLPALASVTAMETHVEQAKTTKFCLSCHVMKPYGRSLYVDDDEFVPAMHFQNNRVPRDEACYTCHTTYALFGGVTSKLRGLRHIAVYYLGTVPDTIRLYTPYQNRECLHCHAGSRKFLKVSGHHDTDTTLTAMMSGRLSCMSSGCHDVVHNVHELAEAKMWKEGER